MNTFMIFNLNRTIKEIKNHLTHQDLISGDILIRLHDAGASKFVRLSGSQFQWRKIKDLPTRP